jgi:hypothetical protein
MSSQVTRTEMIDYLTGHLNNILERKDKIQIMIDGGLITKEDANRPYIILKKIIKIIEHHETKK